MFSFSCSPPSIHHLAFVLRHIFSLSPILNSSFFSSASYDKITLLGFIFDDLSVSHDYFVLILHSVLSNLVYHALYFLHSLTNITKVKQRIQQKPRLCNSFSVYLKFGFGTNKYLTPFDILINQSISVSIFNIKFHFFFSTFAASCQCLIYDASLFLEP